MQLNQQYAPYDQKSKETMERPFPSELNNETRVRRLLVDNRDRDGYPNTDPFDFVVQLDNINTVGPLENVLAVDLKALTFPKIANEMYTVLQIQEFDDDNLEVSDPTIQRGYAVAFFDSDQLTAGQIKSIKGADFYQKTIKFNPPVAKISKLRCRFLKHGGNVVSTTDTNNVANVTMMFELICGPKRVQY